jgi:hypothetical protein
MYYIRHRVVWWKFIVWEKLFVSSLATLKVEAAKSFETFENIYEITPGHFPEHRYSSKTSA